jgi:hypothetical protein
MPQIYQGQSLGGSLGSAFGTGLGGTLSQLANQRANRLKQQAGLSGVPGISPEQAEQLANLDPQTLGPVLKELISQPRRAAFGNAVSGLANRLFQVPGSQGENQEQEPIDLSQLNPQEALQLINTQLNAENRKSQQEEKQREFDERLAQRKSEQEEKSALKKEEQDLKYATSVRPFLKEQQKEYSQQKKVKRLAQDALKIIEANKDSWPGAITGNLPIALQTLFQRNPAIRKYMADIDQLVLEKAGTRKGNPTEWKVKLEQLGKAGTDKPVQTQIDILKDIIRDADEVEEDQRYIHSTKNKETGRYPLDIEQRLVGFDMARQNPLQHPEFYEEGTNYTDDDGSEYEIVNGKWEPKE